LSTPWLRSLVALLLPLLLLSSPPLAGRLAADGGADDGAQVGNAGEAAREAYSEQIPGTGVSLRMVPIPPAEGKPGFWMSECEITWDAFDFFIFGIDGARDREGDSVDAYTRPSKPYIPPDRGFGHEGYPVISSSYRSAKQFCRWLSAKTGHTYRLPTVTEWRHAAAAGSPARYPFGDDPASLGEYAWFDGNADWTTHPVRQKKPNAWGLHDILGNAGEWCVEVTPEGKRKVVLCGGNFESPADEVTIDAIARPDESWQVTDPQVPKSRWWLSDAPFAGLRVLREYPAPSVPEGSETPDAGTPDERSSARGPGAASGPSPAAAGTTDSGALEAPEKEIR
jgi:sulfatase modifying factor 1